jgi:methylenetetrahydrofolate dehydrogenase (NADP+)/methenyltetrahydrofolate cyclohydrolase
LETRVLEGKTIAREIRKDVATRVERLGAPVHLAIVLVGQDPASRVYSESIARASSRAGIECSLEELDPGLGAGRIRRSIRALSDEPSVSGIIVQRPLPSGIPDDVVEEIDPAKDVDCATARSFGLLMTGRELFAPCTAMAVLEILAGHGIDAEGADVVIVGRSAVVGKPLACLLLGKRPGRNATVTVCHTGTRDLASHTRAADIVVAAMGRPEAIGRDLISAGATVIDVGINSVDDPSSERGHRLVGDVAFDELLGHAGAVTPVPGGVGSLTTSILLRSVAIAAERTDAARS